MPIVPHNSCIVTMSHIHIKLRQRTDVDSSSSGPGLVEPTPPKSMVFINDVCFDVAAGVPFNVRETFGNDVVLIQALGQPVPTDEWGVTQQPLQHGGFYYLLRSPAQPPDHRTIDLVHFRSS